METSVYSAFCQLLPRHQTAWLVRKSSGHPPTKFAFHQSRGSMRANYKNKFVGTKFAQATSSSSSTSSEEKAEWGEVFSWEIKGGAVEEVWAVTGDFLGVDKWAPNLIERCERVEGEPQKPGCVRKLVLYPEPFTFMYEKLLSMDEPLYSLSYAILPGLTTTPGFSLLRDYVGTFKLSPLQHQKGTLLQWGYVCRPVSTLSQQKTHTIVFSLFQAAVDALKARLSLGDDDSITLISES